MSITMRDDEIVYALMFTTPMGTSAVIISNVAEKPISIPFEQWVLFTTRFPLALYSHFGEALDAKEIVRHQYGIEASVIGWLR